MDEDEYNIGTPSDVLGAGASTDAPTPEDPGFMDLFGDFLFGGGAQGLAGLGLLTGAYNRLGGIGERGLQLGQGLAQTQLGQAAFRPYTVTTATGGQFMAGPDGQYTMAMSPEERAFQQRMFGGAGDFFAQAQADPRLREDEIYGQISEALAPEQRAQQLGLEERLAAQGRLGVRTAEFGGTPEALAMQKAQAQQLSQARLGAAQQARQEQAGLSALGQQYLMGSYLPQQQMLAAFQPGQTAAAQQQQAQLYGTGLFGEATASGIDALLGAGLGQANLMGAAGSGLLSGLFANPEASSGSEDNRSNFFRNMFDYITGFGG